jgi:ArsR family transcriptional regulator
MTVLKSPFAAEPLGRHDAVDLAEAVKALADPARLRLLSFIHQQDEVTVTRLLPLVGLSQSNVSHHLRILAKAGLVQHDKEGSHVYYKINRQGIAEVAGLLNPPRRAARRGGR